MQRLQNPGPFFDLEHPEDRCLAAGEGAPGAHPSNPRRNGAAGYTPDRKKWIDVHVRFLALRCRHLRPSQLAQIGLPRWPMFELSGYCFATELLFNGARSPSCYLTLVVRFEFVHRLGGVSVCCVVGMTGSSSHASRKSPAQDPRVLTVRAVATSFSPLQSSACATVV
jgi:hypothetical protein